jgi:type IV secretory pathway component VirB8
MKQLKIGDEMPEEGMYMAYLPRNKYQAPRKKLWFFKVSYATVHSPNKSIQIKPFGEQISSYRHEKGIMLNINKVQDFTYALNLKDVEVFRLTSEEEYNILMDIV